MKKLRDLVEKVNTISVEADLDIEARGISFDSRTLRRGDIFVAVRGYSSDGHQFIDQAAEQGAVCVLCEKPPTGSMPYILVEDARKALADISAAWFGYPAEKISVVGVTGTNGKTTVTNLIKQIIEKCTGAKVGLIGTNLNMIGDRQLDAKLTTPESYEMQQLMAEMVSEGCQYAVMEVSSHALHLDRVHGIQFDVGVFTNLSPDHLDFHGTIENYANAKALMFKNCKCAAINIDDEYARFMIEGTNCRVITYAVYDGVADIVAKNIMLRADRVDFCALMIGNLIRVALPIPGMFSVYNALAAMSAAMTLGIDIEHIANVMHTCEGVKGRAEVVRTDSDFTVLIDYAHTPAALENIIKTARGFTKGRLITLFGCGGDRDKAKRPMMGEIAARLSDIIIVTSDNPRTEAPSAIIDEIIVGVEKTGALYHRIENRREAIYWALENASAGDVLILAGKGHETYQILGNEKIDFDEREIVKEFFR